LWSHLNVTTPSAANERKPFEPQLVLTRFGFRVRIYAGHTGRLPSLPRLWRWDTGTSRGVSLRLRGERVIGVQWRRSVA
jgi:hypothetical protein